MQVVKSSNNNKVTIGNVLVEASYTMTLVEKRLLLLFVSKVNNIVYASEYALSNYVLDLEVIDSDRYYAITVRDYADTYGIEYETAKDELLEATNKLCYRELTYIEERNGKPCKVYGHWVESYSYYEKETHEVKIRWSNDVIPYISELRENFTTYKMKYLSIFTSFYAVRLYEVFYSTIKKSKKKELIVSFSLDEIRELLELTNKYRLFANLNTDVLVSSIKEINKYTDISVSYIKNGKKDYIKEGKKVVGINFNVSYK